jgi:ABC-type multidrug transport system fused ATPase/permease subunit
MSLKRMILLSVRTFQRRDRLRLLYVTCLQILVGILDVIGVALIGFLGALSVRGVTSSPVGDRTQRVLEFLHIEYFSFQHQAATIGVTAVAMLICKTIISLYLNRRFLFFMSRKTAEFSSALYTDILNQPYIEIKHRSPQEILYKVTSGVNSVYLGVVVGFNSILVDFSMIVLMFTALMFVDFFVAIFMLGFFAVIALIIHKSVNSKSRKLSELHYKQSIICNSSIVEGIHQYRENFIHNTIYSIEQNVQEKRMGLSRTLAELTFLPSISKYVIETAVVTTGLVIGAVQFLTKDAVNAVATLSMFLAASSRIAPSVIRLQQGVVQLQSNRGTALPALREILATVKNSATTVSQLETLWEYENFSPVIKIRNLDFKFEELPTLTISGINLDVAKGETLAIVGPSGSGKSTLADCILGLLQPVSGSILISDVSPIRAIAKWPGAISYVSQNDFLSTGTIFENVCLGLPKHLWDAERAIQSLEMAQLISIPNYSGEILDFFVGENGSKLSGGQRQRISLARALYTEPTLLVLDEASSALDGGTELDLVQALAQLKGKVTIIMIAHRLSTVRYADNVLYLEKGQVISYGTLMEVRKIVPEFDRQFTDQNSH